MAGCMSLVLKYVDITRVRLMQRESKIDDRPGILPDASERHRLPVCC